MISLLSVVAMLMVPSPVGLASVVTMPQSAAHQKDYERADINGTQQVAEAYRDRRSDVIVENVVGLVEAVLPDDLEGSRHQRFTIRLASGQTVLVVHNIDLAPRIDGLREGDRVSVKGEYEWNDRGGLIHWTHHDPRNVHEGGWIEHKEFRYQ